MFEIRPEFRKLLHYRLYGSQIQSYWHKMLTYVSDISSTHKMSYWYLTAEENMSWLFNQFATKFSLCLKIQSLITSINKMCWIFLENFLCLARFFRVFQKSLFIKIVSLKKWIWIFYASLMKNSFYFHEEKFSLLACYYDSTVQTQWYWGGKVLFLII